jgi:hypothetical protein
VSALPPHRSNHGPSSRPAPHEQDDTDLLLDNLSERRGQRPARRQTPDNDLPDMMELDIDGPDGPDGPGGPGGPDGPTAEEPEPDSEPSAAVVDIGARRGGSRPRMPSVKVPDSPADLEWEGPSQWEIEAPRPGSGQEADAGPASETSPADDPAPPAEPEQVPEKPPAEPPQSKRPTAKRGRKSRAQVPSWDEIVFGSRPEV